MDLKYEEDARMAGRTGMTGDRFLAAMRDIHRGDGPVILGDEELDREPPIPSVEPLSPEQATSKLMGAKYVHYLNSLLDRVQKAIAEAEDCIQRLMQERRQSVTARLSAWREQYADAKIGLLVTIVLAVLIPATILGEVHLLVLPLADWMGIENLDKSKTLWLASAAVVVLGFLSLLAHEATDRTQPLAVRAVWGAGLVMSSLLVGFLRSSQTDAKGINGAVIYVWWSWISFGAPLVTARFIDWFLRQLKKWLAFKADQNCHRWLLKWLEEEVAGQRSLIAEGLQQAKSIMQEFAANYRELAFEAQRKVEMQREFKRQTDASTARHWIVYLEERNSLMSAIFRGAGIAPSLVALALLAALAFMALAVAVHAEETGNLAYTVVLLCDRSSSAEGISCEDGQITEAFEKWEAKAVESRKGRFDILIVGKGINDAELFHWEKAPEKLMLPISQGKKRWMKEARERLQSRLNELPRKGTASAIVEGIFRAALRLSGTHGRKTIIVLSDLRQVSGRWNFEREVPDEAVFLEWIDSLGSPDFGGTQVMACGFHAGASGARRLDVAQVMRLRALWEKVFERWGLKVPIMEECEF